MTDTRDYNEAISIRRGHSLRRLREELSEIEELDSEQIKSSSFHRSMHISRSRKRQRTLTERLEELCLNNTKKTKTKNAFELENFFDVSNFGVAQLNGHKKKLNRAKTRRREYEEEKVQVETDEEDNGPFSVYNSVPTTMKNFFFQTSRKNIRSPSMDSIFRQYSQESRSSSPSTCRDIVVFNPSKMPVKLTELPIFQQYLLHREKMTHLLEEQQQQKHHQNVENLSDLDLLGVPPTKMTSEFFNDSMEIDTENSMATRNTALALDFSPRLPHHAGKLSHSEWFLLSNTSTTEKSSATSLTKAMSMATICTKTTMLSH